MNEPFVCPDLSFEYMVFGNSILITLFGRWIDCWATKDELMRVGGTYPLPAKLSASRYGVRSIQITRSEICLPQRISSKTTLDPAVVEFESADLIPDFINRLSQTIAKINAINTGVTENAVSGNSVFINV